MRAILLAAAAAVVFAAACGSKDPRAGVAPIAEPEPPAPTAAPADPVAPPAPHPIDEETRRLLFETPVATLDGEPSSLGAYEGKALLVVNVASKCGLTPQYEGLQRLQQRFEPRGFSVVGFPCNQFGGQEPGTAEEIRTFCDMNYGVTFPLFEKIEVNGDERHPIYRVLTAIPDTEGEVGDIQWNFEKFLISADGAQVTRFRPRTDPEDPQVLAAIEAALP
jgi:glutathione peroxidase